MNAKKIGIMAGVLWLAFQVTGVFNTYMKFNTFQGMIGAIIPSVILAAIYFPVQKALSKRSSDS